jgi:hypothetical protein
LLVVWDAWNWAAGYGCAVTEPYRPMMHQRILTEAQAHMVVIRPTRNG